MRLRRKYAGRRDEKERARCRVTGLSCWALPEGIMEVDSVRNREAIGHRV
jgi:hypothetical protein